MDGDQVQQGAVPHRTARVRVRATPAQARRLYGLLRSAGDVWAALVELNRDRAQRAAPPEVNFQALCRELTGCEVGELSRKCAEQVLRRYTDAWHAAARRRQRGERARYPRRKRHLQPVRWRHGTFTVAGPRRVRLSVAWGGAPPPYPVDRLRAVTLVHDGGGLWLDVTALVAVGGHGLDPDRVAGVDLGLIHPYAAAGPEGHGLLLSGRALRAEARLHLEDTRRRSRTAAGTAPKPGRTASRRWKRHRARRQAAEGRHRRRVRQAHHEAASQVIAWALANRIGTIRVGDLGTILDAPAGPAHRWRTREWRHGHLLRALVDKAQQAGITVQVVDERGSSSTCPNCRARHKPVGRRFACRSCGLSCHRDLVGATNIARRTPPAGNQEPRLLRPRPWRPRSSRTVAPAVTCPVWPERGVTAAGTCGTPADHRARSCPGLGRPRHARGSRTHRHQRTWIAPTARGQPPKPSTRQTTSLRP